MISTFKAIFALAVLCNDKLYWLLFLALCL